MAALTDRRGTFMSTLTADGASTNTFVADAFPTARVLVVYVLASITLGTIALQQSIDGSTWVDADTAISATSEVYITITKPVGMYRMNAAGSFDGDAVARYEVKG